MFDFDCTREIFRSRYFEREPLYLHACFDASPFGWLLVEQALDLQDPSRELFKLLHHGRIEPEDYVEDFMDIGIRRRRIIKDKLYDRLVAGATIVLNRIELVSPEVRDICLEIGRFVGAQTTANAYASIGGDAAMNVHWDTHDVFVVQLSGRKHWRIYEPTLSLPISSQVSNDRKDELPAEPHIDRIIEAGDILYVPRGWWHRVEPVAGETTIHLTVAVHAPLILDYLIWAAASILPEHVEFRHSLLGDPADLERVGAALHQATKQLLQPDSLQQFYLRSRQRDRVVAPFNIDTLLDRSTASIDDDATVALNARHPDASTSSFIINGRLLVLAPDQLHVVRALAGETIITVGALKERVVPMTEEMLGNVLRDLIRSDVISVRRRHESLKMPEAADARENDF